MIVERLTAFWKKVERRGPDECWRWTGSRTEGGYGQLWTGAKRRGSTVKCLATHIALLLDGRVRPSPQHVAMHSCDNPSCVNPAHLSWGTALDNNLDRVWKARARSAARRENKAGGPARAAAAKLTVSQVHYIRRSDRSSCQLAHDLGVSDQCILNVRAGRTWKNVGSSN
jgi:hypothetical protein